MKTQTMEKKAKENTRVGVFLCECGREIAGSLDLGRIKEKVSKCNSVAFVKSMPYPCSKKGLAELKGTVAEQGLTHIVVAGCSPRTHSLLFRNACQEAGLHRSFFELVNIREHCSRVHQKNKARATSKAVELIHMGVAKVIFSEPRGFLREKVEPVAAVIGGGISGMTAALGLAARGVQVKLVEKEKALGGRLRDLHFVYPSYTGGMEFLREKVAEIEENPNIEVLFNTRVTKVNGHLGNYRITVRDSNGSREFLAGVIVVATGSEVFVPHGMYGYGTDKRILTQIELEKRMKKGDLKASHVVMVQCVGSRNEERPYCSRVCCTASVKNTIALKEKDPKMKITVLSRGFAEYVGDLDRAREMGVSFIRYDPARPPEVKDGLVKVFDSIAEMETYIPYDLVVLATPLIPRSNGEELSRIFKVPQDRYGFLVESHLKLRPGDFVPHGVYLAGSVHWPATISECISQGYGAAARAYSVIETGVVEKEPIVAVLEEGVCRGCGRCAEVCEHHAIEMVEKEDGLKQAMLDEIICNGCGVCVAVCPSGAISLGHLRPEQMEAVLDAALLYNPNNA